MKQKVLWCGLSFLLVAALVLASCGPAEVVGEQEEEEEEEEEVGEEEEVEVVPPVGAPQHGGTLTVFRGVSAGTDSTDMTGTEVIAVTPLVGPIIDYLVMGDFETYGPRGTNEFPFNIGAIVQVDKKFLRGALAESWELHWPSSVVIHIRPGVYWQAMGKEHVMESRELTAADVVFSMTHAYDTVLQMALTEHGGFIDRVYAADKYTVIVETSSYLVSWLRCLSGYQLGVYAPEVIEAGLDDWNELVGTGPFMFKKYVAGSHMTYARNPNFWGSPITINGTEYEIPFVDELVYALIPDMSTKVAALRTGKLDIYHKMSLKYEDTLAQTTPELLKLSILKDDVTVLPLKCDKEPFNNRNVRRAMMMALDREAMVKALMIKGEANPWLIGGFSAGQAPLEVYSASNREVFEYNPEKARQMLIDEGYPEGFKVTGIIFSGGADVLTMAKSYWEAIGVELDIEVYEWVTWTSKAYSGEGYEVSMDWGPNRTASHTSGKLVSKFIPWYNTAFYSSPSFDEWHLGVERTSDQVEQDAGWLELAKFALDEVAYITIGSPYICTYWWPWVKNFYGEFSTTQAAASFVEAATWIDQDLKAEMGY